MDQIERHGNRVILVGTSRSSYGQVPYLSIEWTFFGHTDAPALSSKEKPQLNMPPSPSPFPHRLTLSKATQILATAEIRNFGVLHTGERMSSGG